MTPVGDGRPLLPTRRSREWFAFAAPDSTPGRVPRMARVEAFPEAVFTNRAQPPQFRTRSHIRVVGSNRKRTSERQPDRTKSIRDRPDRRQIGRAGTDWE